MRTPPAAAIAVASLLLAAGASASERILSSGKLDASQGFDFSCSLVNKTDASFQVELRLKDADGDTYVDPSTFQPAVLETNLDPGDAAMLVAPAAAVGATSLYCWAEVPEEVAVFGTFLVRDAQDRATAATPLAEDVNTAALALEQKLDDIHAKIQPGVPGPVTGLEVIESCIDTSQPPGNLAGISASCTAPKLAVGGGCKALGNVQSISRFNNYNNAAVQTPVADTWFCNWRNTSAMTETAQLCAQIICADSFPPDEDD